MTAPTPAPAGATYTDAAGAELHFHRRETDGTVLVTHLAGPLVAYGKAHAHFAAIYPPGSDASYVPASDNDTSLPAPEATDRLEILEKIVRNIWAVVERDTNQPRRDRINTLLECLDAEATRRLASK